MEQSQSSWATGGPTFSSTSQEPNNFPFPDHSSTLRIDDARVGKIDHTSPLSFDHSSTSTSQPPPLPHAASLTSPVRRKPVGASSPAGPSPIVTKGEHVAALSLNQIQASSERYTSPPVSGDAVVRKQLTSPPLRRALNRPPPILSSDIPQSPGFIPFHELSADQARRVLDGLDVSQYSPSTLTHARNSQPPDSPLKSRFRAGHHQSYSSDTAMPGRLEGPGPIQILPPHNLSPNGPPTPSQNVSKFGSFFGWKGKPPSSPINDSSATTISDRSTPAQSPNGTSLTSFPISGKMPPSAIDTSRANAPSAALFSNVFPQAPPTPAISYQLEEMEDELKEISAELAGSIRREMELEEEVERLQLEGPRALEKDKRTSDYFSDSGASSTRDPDVPVMKVDDMEKLKRRSEQEKAQFKLDLSQKLQDERGRRKKLDEHVRSLEEHIQSLEQGAGGGSARVVELERRLSDEKRHKDNFEEMIKALRDDCENHKDERDNLRDEVVPSLRARVEGLESEAAEYQNLTYENTRMQQELQALKSGSGLGRASSILGRSGGLARSGSVKTQESREQLAERVKDVEQQRDALHRALKSLLDRQRMQTREHDKRVQQLQDERDAALEGQTPRRKCFEREVTELRAEIDHLRKRADDALAQKWQCEKGLGGLKTDLDRAEQETGSLRRLLLEHDILVPDDVDPATATDLLASAPVTSATLEQAFKELASARAQAESMQEMSAHNESERENMSRQLNAAGQRVEVLKSQVKRQLTQNADLRERLAIAVSRGERQQKESAMRVSELQTRLRNLEDGLSTAQGYSEDSITPHEDAMRDIRMTAGSAKLQRLKAGLSSPMSPSALSPIVANGNGPRSPFVNEAKSPRLTQTSSGPGTSMAEALRTEQLESRVRELERALKDADAEMSEVVQRMNLAQMEVMELQTARDDAMKMTRALQSQLEAERASMGSLAKSMTK